jgi:hypothetical protein
MELIRTEILLEMQALTIGKFAGGSHVIITLASSLPNISISVVVSIVSTVI